MFLQETNFKDLAIFRQLALMMILGGVLHGFFVFTPFCIYYRGNGQFFYIPPTVMCGNIESHYVQMYIILLPKIITLKMIQ